MPPRSSRIPSRRPATGIGGARWIGWAVLIGRTVRGAFRDDFGIAASSIAFAAFLALIPMAGLVAGIYGLVASPAAVAANIARLSLILPAGAHRIVAQGLDSGLVDRHGGVAALAVPLGVALFSARRAGRSLLHGINRACRVEVERRGWRRQLVALLLVLGCAGLVLTALVSLSVLAFLQSYVPDGLPGARAITALILFASLTVGAGGGLALAYRYAPANGPVDWARIWPGTLFGVALWGAATLAFRWYVAHLARFDDSYGSLSAVVVLLLWLMLSAWALLLGARLNAEAMAGGVALR